MFKKLSIIIILALILTSLFYFKSNIEIGKKYSLNINNKEISLILANTPETRNKGLGSREFLPKDTGMLFIFDTQERYRFWMKDMKFPIDIIWLDEKGKIVYIENKISPDTYPRTFIPPQNSLYVIEFNAGFAQENQLLVGNVLNFIK